VKRVHTSLRIDAPPAALWSALADFASYPEWNPLIRGAEGTPGPGAKLRLTIARPDKDGQIGQINVQIVEWQPERALAWRGNLWPIFDGRHWFRLTPKSGGTFLEHGEDMRGLYPILLGERGRARFAPHYQAVNEALARRLA
jgi:hypothetical protein